MENNLVTNTLLYDNKRTKALAALVATAILWSFGGVLIKLVNWNPIAIAGMRSAIAALLHLAIMRNVRIKWSLSKIGCALAYSATVIAFVSANKLTTSANAILLQYSAPIFVALFSIWFLKERPKLLDWISIAAVLGGMILFFLDDIKPGNMLGNILAIFSGITFATMIVLMRSQKSEAPLESAFLGNVITAVIGIPFMFQSMPDAKSWLGLGLLGIFQLGLAYVFYSYAIKHVTAMEGVLIPVIEPILNPVWAAIVLSEVPGKWALIGGLIVISAITLRCIANVKFSIRKST